MEVVENGGYPAAIGVDGGQRSGVSWGSATGVGGDHALEELGGRDHGHRCGQEFVVHVAGSVFDGIDGGGGGVDFVARKHEGSMR